MEINLPHKSFQLFILGFLLVLINVFIIFNYDIDISRLARVSTTFFLFLFFLFYKKYWQGFIFIALILFTVRDIMMINYEESFYKTSVFFFTIVAYIALISYSLKKMQLSRFTPLLVVYTLLMVALNVFNVFYLSDVIQEGLDNTLQLALFYVQGGILLFLGIVGYMYYDRFFGKMPLYYLYFVLCFIFSDLSGLAAYFFHIDFAYFVERTFYILGLLLLVNFNFNANAEHTEKYLSSERESYL